jgi:AraC family transcriptional regulator of adaptative response/methylated-DNA-[protein]-cysteine methyltransferase
VRGPTNSAWRAVMQRDRRLDGHFVYVALSTHIYCRPSCPARLPQRKRVVILPSPAEAERSGYVACRRCHPASASPSPAEMSIQHALAVMKLRSDEPLALSALARTSGLSPNHFHRVFVRIVGISPKSFCNLQRLARLKELLKSGASASAAGYGAGYGSARALYESAASGLGMTPAVYQRGGRGVRIRYALANVALGRVLIAASDAGVCALLFGAESESLVQRLSQEFPDAVLTHKRHMPASWLVALGRAQREDPLLLRLPASTRRDVFQAKVRKILSLSF